MTVPFITEKSYNSQFKFIRKLCTVNSQSEVDVDKGRLALARKFLSKSGILNGHNAIVDRNEHLILDIVPKEPPEGTKKRGYKTERRD